MVKHSKSKLWSGWRSCWMDYLLPIHSQRTQGRHVITIEQLVNKWHAQNNVPQFAYPSQCLYDTSSWDSISGEKLFTDENDQNSIEKQVRWKMSLLLNHSQGGQMPPWKKSWIVSFSSLNPTPTPSAPPHFPSHPLPRYTGLKLMHTWKKLPKSLDIQPSATCKFINFIDKLINNSVGGSIILLNKCSHYKSEGWLE